MKARLPIFMNLYRGGAAIVLGIVLLFNPDRSGHFLLNLMGFFWLTIGLTVLRRGEQDARYPGRYTARITGLVAILTGILVVTRRFTQRWLGEELFFFILGTVILITGLLHMFSEQRIGSFKRERTTRIHFLLGLFEVLLGGLLILSPDREQPFVYWAATAWAIVYGIAALGIALRHFAKNRQQEKESDAEISTNGD